MFKEYKRYSYPIEVILSGLCTLLTPRVNNKDITTRPYLLYLFMKLSNGKYLPLNRDYKPVGLFGYDGWVNYEEYEHMQISEEVIDLRSLKIPKKEPISPDGSVYFFHDGTTPWHDRKYMNIYIKNILNLFKVDDFETRATRELRKYFLNYDRLDFLRNKNEVKNES